MIGVLCNCCHGGDKVSMLTHTYPHKPQKIKVAICSPHIDVPLYMWPDVCSGDFQAEESVVIHDTECQYREHSERQ